MWDSNAPLQLLKSMPKKLSKENLEKIQLVIDADKYKNSLVSGFDLCGMYAPFCRDCKKASIFPCALAYVKMMQADGMEVEIDAKPVGESEGGKFEKPLKETAVKEEKKLTSEPEKEEEKPSVKQEAAVEAVTAAKDEGEEKESFLPENLESPKQDANRKIRIAIARKKIG